jgi:hypothetical protein
MGKGRKRPPPPPPALTKQDIAHLQWIQRNSTELARSALTLYRKHGRGAFIVKEEDAQPSGTATRYQTVQRLLATGSVWPNEQTTDMVHAYDPAHQFVVVFLYHSGAASAYTLGFIKMGDTFMVEAA